MLLHVLGVGLSRNAERVVARGVELRAEVEKGLDRFAAARDEALHLINVFLDRAGKRGVDVRLAVGGGGDDAEVVRHHVPRDVEAELLAGPAAAAGILLRAPLAYLVQRRFKFKAPSAEAGSAAAGQIVPLYQQRLFPALSHPAGRGKAAVARADDYGIIFSHSLILLICCHVYMSGVVLPRTV